MKRLSLAGLMFGLFSVQPTFAEVDYESDSFKAALHCAAVTASVDRLSNDGRDSPYTPLSAFYVTVMHQSGPKALELFTDRLETLMQIDNDGRMSDADVDALLNDYNECSGWYNTAIQQSPDLGPAMEEVADGLNASVASSKP
jgi:hypothetical protein